MRSASRLLVILVLCVFTASCGGSVAPPVHDYRNGTSSRNASPQSLCVKRQTGWYCSGGGGGGGPVFGTRGSCQTNYIYFSDGCEDDGSDPALYAQWASWYSIIDIALLHFNDSHYWNRHLACYLPGSTNTQVDNAISQDFNNRHYKQAGDPAVGARAQFAFVYTDPQAGQVSITYRIFHLGMYQFGVANYDTYNVGTAFLLDHPNCPGY